MLDEKTFVMVTKRVKTGDVATYHDYHAFTKSRVLHDTCDISHDQGLRIEFGRITKISDILIELTVIGTRLPSQYRQSKNKAVTFLTGVFRA